MKTQYYCKLSKHEHYKFVTKEAFKKILSWCQKDGAQFHIYRSVSNLGNPIKKLHLLPL